MNLQKKNPDRRQPIPGGVTSALPEKTRGHSNPKFRRLCKYALTIKHRPEGDKQRAIRHVLKMAKRYLKGGCQHA